MAVGSLWRSYFLTKPKHRGRTLCAPTKGEGNQKDIAIFEFLTIEHHATGATALDHWFFEHYNFWLKGSGVSAEFKMRNRRHLALDPAPSLDLDHLQKRGS